MKDVEKGYESYNGPATLFPESIWSVRGVLEIVKFEGSKLQACHEWFFQLRTIFSIQVGFVLFQNVRECKS